LLASSGAVYGPPPAETLHLPETYRGAPSPTDDHALYGEGKRIAELMCSAYQKQYGLQCLIARGFSFVGPYMPLETYAIGNFISDYIGRRPIEISGDGTPIRSFLYGADLAIWLWTILVKGAPGRPYNVGSEEAISIAQLANAVPAAIERLSPPTSTEAAHPHAFVHSRYVPSTERARTELALLQWVPLDEAIRRTAAWFDSPAKAQACRACGGSFFTPALLRLENMPSGAQAFLSATSLEADGPTDLEICECSRCGLVQLSNSPVPYYKNVIRASVVSAEMTEFRRRQFTALVERFSLQGKKVFEAGCGRGEFLSLVQEAGVSAYGIEHSRAAVEHCRAKGLNVAEGFIPGETAALHDGPFDAFLILNFLEHLPEPVAALRQMADLLAPAGIGLVEVPNSATIFEKNTFSEFIGDHLTYFTRDTFTRVLGMSGFEILECGEVWHNSILSAVVRKRSARDFSAISASRALLQAELDDYIGQFGARRVAVWGASHQALAVLALARLGGRIRYVVDSAPFKQGKYTPVSHLPVVSPDALRSDPVDAIIVMAASYSLEVAETIRTKFDPKLDIRILKDNCLEMAPGLTLFRAS
jgi:SAM-dependent methyltransferase